MSNLVEAAVSYAARGYYVFPCKPQSKEPATKHGFKDATTDEQVIREWWTDNPQYNIGIRTGPASGIWVLDVDGEQGRDSYLKYQGEIPYDTPQVTTPNGGFHLYFVYDDRADNLRNSVKSIPGLDVRTEGGYVLAPESILDNGRYEYQGNYREPTEAPERLLAALQRPVRGLTGTPVEATIVEGQRNGTVFSRARSLFKQGYDENEVPIGAIIVINEKIISALIGLSLGGRRKNLPLFSTGINVLHSSQPYDSGSSVLSRFN